MKARAYREILRGKRVAMGVLSFVPFLMGVAGYQGCNPCDVDHCNLVPQEINSDKILAIGDSITAFYKKQNCECCQSYADYASIEIGEYIQNEAIGGWRMSLDNGEGIPDQYAKAKAANGEYDVVMLTGGGNDLLLEECENPGRSCTERCADKIEEIVGEMETLVTDIVRDGSDVVMVGHYEAKGLPSGPYSRLPWFNECFSELNSRYQEIANSSPHVSFVSTMDLADPNDESDYAVDGMHPSIELTKKIGKRVAGAL